MTGTTTSNRTGAKHQALAPSVLMDPDHRQTGWWFGNELAWQKRAACARADDADSFFPGGGRPSNKSKKFCAGCPVRDACLDWALTHEEEGIWGGLTEAERQRLLLSRLPILQERLT